MHDAPKLDRVDININMLAQLQRDSDVTNLALAEAVGLSPSPCLARVKCLRKAGFITGFHGRLRSLEIGRAHHRLPLVTHADDRLGGALRYAYAARILAVYSKQPDERTLQPYTAGSSSSLRFDARLQDGVVL
jgi:DNA-binding Lrp family transcriptional regulator